MPSAPSLPQPPARLRLTSPEHILAAVPYLLGFAPSRSVVVLSLRDKQIGLTMRLDIDTPAQELHEVVLQRLRDDGATKAVIVLFDPAEASGSGTLPGYRIGRPLVRAVRREGLTVVDALVVQQGRFWSYVCTNRRCCPPQGRPVPKAGQPDHSLVASAFVALGTAPMASRDELHASIGPAAAERHLELAPAFEEALEAPDASPLVRWRAVVERHVEAPPRRPLPDSEVAHLVVSLSDVLIRDEILSWTAGEEIAGVLAVLRELAPLAPPPFDTQVLASLAWAAYCHGDGALAAAAVNRALDCDPKHSLSRLLEMALTNGVAPESLRGVGRDLRRLETRACSRSRDAR